MSLLFEKNYIFPKNQEIALVSRGWWCDDASQISDMNFDVIVGKAATAAAPIR